MTLPSVPISLHSAQQWVCIKRRPWISLATRMLVIFYVSEFKRGKRKHIVSTETCIAPVTISVMAQQISKSNDRDMNGAMYRNIYHTSIMLFLHPAL